MIMKCSLKDIFINILFFIIIIIIIISPSEGVEFPLFLPRGSVISDSMNLQQLRASINRLQDLDSFPVSSENQLHKIVKKQMTNCDYHKRKNKRSIVMIPERLKSFDVMNKGDGYSKSRLDKPEILKSRDSLSIPTYEICLSKLAQFARNSGIRFAPDKLKNDDLTESVQKKRPPEPSVGNQMSPQMSPPFKEDKVEVLKMDDIPEKEKNPEELTQEVLDNIKAIMNSDLYSKANENKIKDIAKMMKDDEYQQVEDLNLPLPCMTVEDKIKEYLLEDQLPEIKLQAGETEDKIKENETKNKMLKGSEDKIEVKEPKEKKDPPSEDKKKLRDQKNDKQVEKAEEKNLDDVKTWENMSEKEMAKVTKEREEKKKKEEEELMRNNPNLKSKFQRIPDQNDFRYYYECEARPNGCLKLRHKRCPQGQFFSFKFLKCLKAENKDCSKQSITKNKSSILKRQTSFDTFTGNSEPANEWLDASQDYSTVVPSEFQSTTEHGLRIYHLRQKRKFREMTGREMPENVEPEIGNRPEILNEAPKSIENPEVPYDGIFRKHRKHHAPRSYVIRIKKKEGKDQITENNENDIDNDEDDQDSEDDDEDEEVEDEEEENDEEDMSDDTTTKTESSGQGLRDLFKAAKTAVTNRARFEDPTLVIAANAGTKVSAQNASKKEAADSDNQKKVLIDANIKVDSTIGTVLKSLMKNKRKESLSSLTGDEASLISDRGSQDQLDPELLRMYEHLMRSNPRVKRYFLANRYKKGK